MSQMQIARALSEIPVLRDAGGALVIPELEVGVKWRGGGEGRRDCTL